LRVIRRGLVLLTVVSAVACARRGIAGSFTAGDSMLPTIPVGASLVVNPHDTHLPHGRAVVFRWQQNPEREYVKRVVGLSGDVVSSRGTEIAVNGIPIPRCHVGAWGYADAGGETHRGEIWVEALEGSTWLVFHDAARSGAVPDGSWTVAPGEVFVLADNRENSQDSRVWYGGRGGGLPIPWIVGTVTQAGVPTLPNGAEALQSALDTCVAALGR
jgi:signal peptidase I